jgi:hypothetical protein
MKHFLANFVYYEATGGVWNTTDDRANVDTTLWTTWQARYYGNPTAFSCSRYIGESTTAIDELQSWAATFQASLFFTPSGTIGIRFDPLTTPVDTSVLQAYRLGANLRNLTPAFNTQDLYKRVSGNYRFFASQAQYQEELTVFNQPAKINSADPIDLSWGPVY